MDKLVAADVDVVMVAGDLIYGGRPVDDQSPLETQPTVLEMLRSLVKIAPVYTSLGNHEKFLDSTDQGLISATGAVVLDNEFRIIEVRGTHVIVGGLTSAYVSEYRMWKPQNGKERYPDLPRELHLEHKPEQGWLSDFAAVDGYHVLLSHHPEYFPMITRAVGGVGDGAVVDVELVLSGHAHGGQWNYYSFKDRRWKGVFAPGQGLWPRYTSGVYERDGSRLVVSRGMSNTAGVPRLFNPTEVVIVEPEE